MKASASSSPRRRVVKRIAVFFSVLLVLCVIAVGGWRLYTRGPNPRDVAEGRSQLYQSWCEENKDAYEAFKELARANGWQMYVRTNEGLDFWWGWGSIGRLDCGQSTYTPLYKPSRDGFINVVSSFREGKVAFIECTREFSFWRRIKERDYELGVLHSDGTVTKVRLPEIGHVSDLAIGNRYVFFCDGSEFPDRLWLYDVQEQALRNVPKPQRSEGGVERVAIAGDRFLLVVTMREVLLVVETRAPDALVSRMEGISNVLVVGERVIVQKDDVCFLYDPESGGTERLTPGRLVVAMGKDEFLFCAADERPPAYLTDALYRYNIVAHSADVFWQPPKGQGGFRLERGEEKVYEDRKAVLSPDGRFLFVPRLIPPYARDETVLTFEYDIYDLRSGQKCGSFLTIHEGKFYFEFLGWDISDGAARSAAPKPQGIPIVRSALVFVVSYKERAWHKQSQAC